MPFPILLNYCELNRNIETVNSSLHVYIPNANAWRNTSYLDIPNADVPMRAWKSGKTAHLVGLVRAKVDIPIITAMITMPDDFKPAFAVTNYVINSAGTVTQLSINNGVIYTDNGIPAGTVVTLNLTYVVI